MKKYFSLLIALALLAALALPALAEDAPINVLALKGPTGIGMVQMMDQNDGTYAFALAGVDPRRTRLATMGEPGLVALLKPATSSESAMGGAKLPSLESEFATFAARLGAKAPGVLTMPWSVRLS